MQPLLPSEAPQTPEKWQDVMADIERVIMPGVSENSKKQKPEQTIEKSVEYYPKKHPARFNDLWPDSHD